MVFWKNLKIVVLKIGHYGTKKVKNDPFNF